MPERDFEERTFFRGLISSGATKIVPEVGFVSVIQNMAFTNIGASVARVSVYLVPGSQLGKQDKDTFIPDMEIPPKGILEWHGWRVLGVDPDDPDRTETIYAEASGQVAGFIDGAIVEDL